MRGGGSSLPEALTTHRGGGSRTRTPGVDPSPGCLMGQVLRLPPQVGGERLRSQVPVPPGAGGEAPADLPEERTLSVDLSLLRVTLLGRPPLPLVGQVPALQNQGRI